MRLTEVDTFGNYSSAHYKGTVQFYKVSRGQVEWRGDRAGLKDRRMLQDAVCSLPLTLPKVTSSSAKLLFQLTPVSKALKENQMSPFNIFFLESEDH